MSGWVDRDRKEQRYSLETTGLGAGNMAKVYTNSKNFPPHVRGFLSARRAGLTGTRTGVARPAPPRRKACPRPPSTTHMHTHARARAHTHACTHAHVIDKLGCLPAAIRQCILSTIMFGLEPLGLGLNNMTTPTRPQQHDHSDSASTT